MYDLPKLLILAETAAKQAGVVLAQRPDGYVHINALSASDIKLAADVASEKLIREALSPTGIPIVGEEEGGDISLMDQDVLYWVIDPLDGTYNYARGLPFCCVSIGLMSGLEPVLGVIYDFNTQTSYRALATGPLEINGKPHNPNWIEDQNTALLLSSLRYDDGAKGMVPTDFEELHGSFKKVRFFGTASLSLAWVASGYAEGYIERCVHLWDIAAGLSLLKAAGGHFRIELGHKKPFQLDCFAAAKEAWL
jgi:myo-inositol-1(or 4)-monophosphatase